jgi:hypothetical protein
MQAKQVKQFEPCRPYQVTGNDHFVFGQLDVLRDPQALEQSLGLFLCLKLLFSVK